MDNLIIRSPAFTYNGMIPSRYTCDAENVSPPLSIENVPENTKSLVLIMDDPDAPMGTWTHWVVWNITPTLNSIKEGIVPGIEGVNDFKKINYGGPCPPSGTHRYFFRLYALDMPLKQKYGAKRSDVEDAMHGHIIASSELIGLYGRR